MSTIPTEITLSSHIREELIAKLAINWIEVISDDLEDLVLSGFVGLKNYSDYDLLSEYEMIYSEDLLDSSENELTNLRDDFVCRLKLDIATNRMIDAKS
jgi:hypothetical protein